MGKASPPRFLGQKIGRFTRLTKFELLKLFFRAALFYLSQCLALPCVCVHTCVCKHTLESEQFHTECWPLGSSTESQGRSAEPCSPARPRPGPGQPRPNHAPPRHSHVQTTPLTCQTTPIPRPSCPDHAQPRQAAPHHAPATPKNTPRHARPRPQAGRAPELSEEGHVRARRVPSPTRPADGSCEPPTPPRGWDKPRLDDDLWLRGSEGALFKVLGRRGKDPFLSEPYAHMAVNVEGLVFASVGHTRIKRP